MPTSPILAWHFVADTLRDGSPIPADGVTLTHTGPVVPCESGYHASVKPLDALIYAPGNILCRVECHTDIRYHDDDKLVARCRTILWRIDATELLRAFARRCALDVAHRWDMPDVVRRYLETGDESLRQVAYYAAADAAYAAAADAAYAAAAATTARYAYAAAYAAAAARYADADADAARFAIMRIKQNYTLLDLIRAEAVTQGLTLSIEDK